MPRPARKPLLLPYVVTDTKGVKPGYLCPILGRFATEAEAAAFIDTLPGAHRGRYGLDGPPADDPERDNDDPTYRGPARLLHDSIADDGDGRIWSDGPDGRPLTPPISPDGLGAEIVRRWNAHDALLALVAEIAALPPYLGDSVRRARALVAAAERG